MKFFTIISLTLLFAVSVFAQKQAEVIVTTTYLRKAPDSNAEKVQTVQKGEKVTFEKNQDTNGWYYVSTSNGAIKGWVRQDTIGAVINKEPINQIPRPNFPKSPDRQKPSAAQPVKSPPPVIQTPNISQKPNILPTPNVVPPTAPAAAPIPEPEEVISVDTQEVNLNVRVVDDNNRTVKNLDKAQFKVYEDGVSQPITSLTTAEVPIINALVIDNSRSLRSQLEKVIEAGKIIVDTNRPKDESAIVRFVSKDKIEVVQNFTSGKNLLDNALDNLFVEGGQTAIIDAIYQTARNIEQYQNSQNKDDVRRRALILVSDGDDRSSSVSEQQLFELLRGSQVQIYAIGFVNNLSKESDGGDRQAKARDFLTRLTEETGGKVYFPNSIDELPQIAADISGELHTQYLISYVPTNEIRDGQFRKIKVAVADGANGDKRIAITRTGRTSAPK